MRRRFELFERLNAQLLVQMVCQHWADARNRGEQGDRVSYASQTGEDR
jgi:hypothetical protein